MSKMHKVVICPQCGKDCMLTFDPVMELDYWMCPSHGLVLDPTPYEGKGGSRE